MATAFALLAGVLLPCWGALPQFRKGLMKMNGAWCSHHSQCISDCCLMNLDYGGTFCAPKARRAMVCLPQTKGATNVICPCQLGLTCISKDLNCPRRCHLI
ncbi:colipase-like protein 2 [Pteronotus mesoamericanus]|uniref:colipase-like protein 2 n=1 Tax=Pteronotus mesoamericanus TaxID=1884717 RepID=UPI0023EDE6C6|nr:colipase-like protein 2 [Pteronotus parnellii mesoamericanus]